MTVSVFGVQFTVTAIAEEFASFCKRLFSANPNPWITPQGSRLASVDDILGTLGKATNAEEAAVLNRIRDTTMQNYDNLVKLLNSSIDNEKIVTCSIDGHNYVLNARKNKYGRYQISFAPPSWESSDVPAPKQEAIVEQAF